MTAEPPGALVERSEQLEAVARRLADVVEQREGAVVFLGGEAGAGKTSLVHAFAARSSVRVVVGGSENLRTPRAHGPLLDLAAELGGDLSLLVEQGASPGDLVDALADTVSQPTVLVFEDLHWADEATLDLLRVLARRLRRVPALVLATYRDDELSRTHPLRVLLGELATERRVHRVSLPLLSADGVALLARGRAVDVERLHQLTGGNPFFVTEVLAAGSDGAPDTVLDAVLARAARLPPLTRRLLEAVAVVPSRAEQWLLDAIAPLSLTGLEECLASGMLVADRETVQFRHEIARTSIEESLPPDLALSLHRRALGALVERGESIDPARVAHHAAAVGDGRSVLAYAPVAADRAARLRAHREAAAHLASALRYVDQLPRSGRVDLFERHAYECYLISQPQLAGESRRRALAEHEAAGDRLRQGDTHRWLSRLAWFSGDGETAETEARRAIDLLEPLGLTTELAMAYSNQSQLCMLADDTAGAREWGGRAIRLAEQLDDQEILAHALNNVGTAEAMGGMPEGMTALERSLRIAQAHGLEEHVARAFTNLASTAVAMHDLDAGLRWSDEGIEYCAEHDLDSWRLYMTGCRARAHLERGSWDPALADATTARETPSLAPTLVNPLVVLGRIRARRGDGDPWPLLDEALSVATRTHELQRLVPVAAARAEVRLLEGSPELVAAETDEVVAALDRAGGPVASSGEVLVLRRRAGLVDPPYDGLAEAWALELADRHREAAEAWATLGFPYERASAMVFSADDDLARVGLVALQDLGATAAAAAAARRLRDRGVQGLSRGPRAATARTPYGLTPRQLEVLGLLATGLRNSEIASAMVLSERTVDHHVSAVLAKLAVQTRAQAVRLAVREGLVSDGGDPVPAD
jgi:DNA-binding CsgD family transcriptional regulator/tetratricopeptide (TPR) repeat protein